MKPPPFDYLRPTSLPEALQLLADRGPDAKVLAGGQSLAPMLNLRLARPEVLVDIGRLPGLRFVRMEGDELAVGALTRHAQLEHYPVPLPGFDVLREAAALVGHHPIRTRGTIGGSIAHADAAAEWCILALLLEARFRLASVRGERWAAADDFFEGMFATALADDELLLEIRFPRPRPHAAIVEFSRRVGDFAIVAAAITFDVVDGLMQDARVVFGGVASVPWRAVEAEDVLRGRAPGEASFAEAGQAAAAVVEPPDDVHATAEVRRHLVASLLQRAGARALQPHPEVIGDG